MCRLLFVKESKEFNPKKYLDSFAEKCRDSKEYQGHGWGMAILQKGDWFIYKNILPIWEDELNKFSNTTMMAVHARSAFEDKNIAVENNMPFINSGKVFIFNGELRGVKLKMDGRIGAEKIFKFIMRFYKGSLEKGVKKASSIIVKRTLKLRAMNFIIVDKSEIVIHSLFNEDENYFTLRKRDDDNTIAVCSEELDLFTNWEKISNNSIEVIKW